MSDLDGEAVLSLEDEECETFDGFSQKDVATAQKRLDKKRTCKRKSDEKSKSKKRDKRVTFATDIDKLSKTELDRLRIKLGITSDVSVNEHDEHDEPDLICHRDPEDIVTDDWFRDEDEWQPPKLKTPDRGEPIRDSLANMIETAFTAQCATEEIVGKYRVPKNCEKIEAPLVNTEVWGEVGKKAHSDDKSLKDIQNLITAGVLPLIKLAEDSKVNASKQVRACFQESLTLLGQAQFRLSLRRRYNLRPHMKKKYSKLCSLNTPVTTSLFGDDIAKEMKKCESAIRIGRDSNWTPQTRGRGFGFRRFNPYPVQSPRRGYSNSYSYRGAYSQRGHRGRGRPSATAPNPETSGQ